MIELRRPSNPFLAAVFWSVRIYLICFLAGCAATRPLPVEEARALQTKTYDTDYETLFDASRACLQDLNYKVEVVDYEAGTIVGNRETQRELGAIATEDEGLPTWAIVLLIATGVIIIIGAVALLSGGDDEKADDHAGSREKPHYVEPETHVTEVYTTEQPDYTDFYTYDVTLNLKPLPDGLTEIRVNVNGMRIEDGHVDRTGPVHDPLFYDEFFAALNEAVRIEETR